MTRCGNTVRTFMACLALVVAVVASPAQTPLDSNIRSLQARLKLYPTDFRSCDQLGAAYIQKGRETADASYFELARDALNKSLDLVSNDLPAASAKTHLAVVAMAEHQFQEALGWAQEALALGSGDPSAWAIAGDALTDMGEYDRAAEAYARLRDPLHPEEEATALVYERLSRQAYLRFIRGDAAGAINLMREATALAATLHLPAENVAWSQYQLGELCFKSGDLAGAEQAYRAGLNVQPNSYRNLAGLGEVRSAQEKYAEAIAFYQKAIAVAPYPSFAAALYDLNLRAGRSDEARKQLALIEFIVRLNPVNERLFYRELALFYADHDLKLKESLDLARKELEVRHDVYTWDILAWVLYKNGRAREAGEAMEKALAPGTRDALLDYHAGLIEFELGHDAHARSLLESALALSPHFPAAYSGQARQILERIASGDLESRVRR